MTMTATIKLHRSRAPDDNCPHILVIDDDSRIRDLLARYLQEHGFRVTTAIDAASALPSEYPHWMLTRQSADRIGQVNGTA